MKVLFDESDISSQLLDVSGAWQKIDEAQQRLDYEKKMLVDRLKHENLYSYKFDDAFDAVKQAYDEENPDAIKVELKRLSQLLEVEPPPRDLMNVISSRVGMPEPFVFPNEFQMQHQIEHGEPFVVGARSGVGKTRFAMNMILWNISQKIHTTLYTFEQDVHQVIIVLYQIWRYKKTGEAYSYMTVDNWLRNSENSAVKEFVKTIRKYVKIIPANGMNVMQVCANHIKHGGDFVIVDYIQIMNIQAKSFREGIINVMNTFRYHARKENVGAEYQFLTYNLYNNANIPYTEPINHNINPYIINIDFLIIILSPPFSNSMAP